jgi:DNA sulfur modification protein DndE
MSCNDVKSSEDRIKPIRYIIVIDEAHAYLKHKNMASVLENLLRMVRSKGVIVMMISQGIAEYKQKEFDFSSQVKIPILLNIQNKDLKQAKSFVGTPKSDSRLRTVLHQLEGGKGVINFEESKLMDINMFWQRKL